MHLFIPYFSPQFSTKHPMLYYLLRPLTHITLKVFFRKVYFSNEQNIPKDKPVILATNHPTAFIEPCVIACCLDTDMHFIVRGDIFKKPLYRKFLMALKMIPIYRSTDGFSKMKQNFATLDYCYEALNDKKTIMILSEGKTIQEKRLRPIQKGTARMAFGTWDKYGKDLDIQIVPVGVNYTYADKFRSEVMIDFGKPIVLRDYLAMYEENDKKAIRILTKDLAEGMKARIITIEKVADEELTENLFTLYRNNTLQKPLPIESNDEKRLIAEQNIANKINELSEEAKISLKSEVDAYFQQVRAADTSDFGVAQGHSWLGLRKLIILIIGFVPFLLGYVLNFLPAWYANHVGETSVKQLEFIASVKIAVAMGGFMLYYFLCLVAAIIVGTWHFWVFILMIPIWGYVAVLYRDFYKKWKAARSFTKLDKAMQQQLADKRKTIVARAFVTKIHA